jgi:hypothetical protein
MRKNTSSASNFLSSCQSEDYSAAVDNNNDVLANADFYLGNNNEQTVPQQRFFSNDAQNAANDFDFNPAATDGMPDWLKKDMEDADFIPIEALENKMKPPTIEEARVQAPQFDTSSIKVKRLRS